MHVMGVFIRLFSLSRLVEGTLCNMSPCPLYAKCTCMTDCSYVLASCVWFCLLLKFPPLCCVYPLSRCL